MTAERVRARFGLRQKGDDDYTRVSFDVSAPAIAAPPNILCVVRSTGRE